MSEESMRIRDIATHAENQRLREEVRILHGKLNAAMNELEGLRKARVKAPAPKPRLARMMEAWTAQNNL